ncbi:MAG: hypothetical protein ACTTJC_06820 [Campylobacter sp.]
MAFMLNKFNTIYEHANALLNQTLSLKKNYTSTNKSSLIIAKNDININSNDILISVANLKADET